MDRTSYVDNGFETMLNVGDIAMIVMSSSRVRCYFDDKMCGLLSQRGSLSFKSHIMLLFIIEVHSERHLLSFKAYSPDLDAVRWFLGNDLNEIR